MDSDNLEAKKKRCDSCGNPQVDRYYNRSNLCKECFMMDNRGTPRDKSGKVYRGKNNDNPKA
jgi:NMD protein affecting ribosome stability and mRNA decay